MMKRHLIIPTLFSALWSFMVNFSSLLSCSFKVIERKADFIQLSSSSTFSLNVCLFLFPLKGDYEASWRLMTLTK